MEEKDKYIIGVDTYDEQAHSYVAGKINPEGILEVIESKTDRDKKQFNEEVLKASQFYNAEIVEPSLPQPKSKNRVYGSEKIIISKEVKEQWKNNFIKYLNEDKSLPFWNIVEEFKNLG